MLMCTIFVFLSIFEFTIVYLLARKGAKPEEDTDDKDADQETPDSFQLKNRSASNIIIKVAINLNC